MLAEIKLHPAFYILSRVDSVTEDGFKAMKRAGINNLILGIESASPRVLKAMNKKNNIWGFMTFLSSEKTSHKILFLYSMQLQEVLNGNR